MRQLLSAVFLFASASFAFAQQSPSEQACNMKLGTEVTQGLQCTAGLIQLRAALDKSEARVKELEAKHEPKKDDKKPDEKKDK